MARQLHTDCWPRAAATGMSEIRLWSWGAPEVSPPPAICKPGILRAAPPESTLRLSHFLGLEHNISHISTTRPVARCFLFLPVSGLGRAAGYLRARKGLLGLNLAIVLYPLKSPLFAPSWLAVSERQVSGRALHVLASGFLLQSPAAQRGSVAAARARSRNPCFVSDNGPVRTLLCVSWQA